MSVERRKLIEVSLPLEAINREAAREKSIRHGHPSTLHLWWARRPLAAARAVLFAQLVDDPSAHPDRYPTETDQQQRREELHDLIRKLVLWENSNDAGILALAHREILDSTNAKPPTILDPFAGGGTIPLEAQRLGLNTFASDLNPVAVLINKALIEIPPTFRDTKPVYPGLSDSEFRTWKGAEGLAADVRAYGKWILDEAEKRLGHLYPKIKLPEGPMARVVAWIWARTVICPNPRCGIETPLVRSWWLAKKKNETAYVIPVVEDGQVHYEVGYDSNRVPASGNNGTVGRNGATCVSCSAAIELNYIRAEGRNRRIGTHLIAIVAEGSRRRVYLPPHPTHSSAATVARPLDVPEGTMSTHPQYMGAPRYGMTEFSDLFTPRQLTAMVTLCDLVVEARDRVFGDALKEGSKAFRSRRAVQGPRRMQTQ